MISATHKIIRGFLAIKLEVIWSASDNPDMVLGQFFGYNLI